jgi:hypothetical protein
MAIRGRIRAALESWRPFSKSMNRYLNDADNDAVWVDDPDRPARLSELQRLSVPRNTKPCEIQPWAP